MASVVVVEPFCVSRIQYIAPTVKVVLEVPAFSNKRARYAMVTMNAQTFVTFDTACNYLFVVTGSFEVKITVGICFCDLL